MKNWALQDAKNQLSHLVDLALTEGPQTITRHGEPVVVVVAAEDYKKSVRPKESILEFFRPLKGSGIDLTRAKDLPRNVKV